MSIDIGQVAAVGRDAIASAINTSGCTVDVYADADDLDDTIDFATLALTDPTPETASAAGLRALIVSEGAEGQPVGPGRETHPTVYRVLLFPDAPAVTEGNVLVVRTCLTTRLINARLLVREVVDDGLGLAQTLRTTRTS